LGDKVKVISTPHGINEYFDCNKIVYNFLDPSQTEYTFGYTGNTLTGNGGADKSIKQLLVNAQQTANGAQQTANGAQQTAQEALETAKNTTADTIEKIYPIGSIYCTTNNVSPTAILGGTWELFDSIVTSSQLSLYAWKRIEQEE